LFSGEALHNIIKFSFTLDNSPRSPVSFCCNWLSWRTSRIYLCA